jgi:hypothetical protein
MEKTKNYMKTYSERIDEAKKSSAESILKLLDSQDKDEFEIAISDPLIQEWLDMVVSEMLNFEFMPRQFKK